jgi:hypothetical protein
VPLEGFAWHGCPRCLLYFKQVPGGLLTPISYRGLFFSRAGGSSRSRVLLAWQGTGSLNASQSRLRFFAAQARLFRRCGRARERVVGGVAGGRDRFASVPAGLRRDDGPSAVMWPLRSWWGPFVGVRRRFPVVNARGTSAPESSPAAYKSEGVGRRRFFTLTPHHFSSPAPSSSPRLCHHAVSPLELIFCFSSSALAFLRPSSWRRLSLSRSWSRTPGRGRR